MKGKTRFLNIFRRLGKIPFIEKFLRSRTKGKFPDSFWARVIPQNYLYEPGTIRECNWDGIKISGDMNDFVFHYIYFGMKDRATENFLNAIKPGEYVIDIGGNLGYLALNISHKTGANGKVYSFEANPVNYQNLVRNVSQNQCCVVPVNLAAGSKPGFISTQKAVESNFGGVFIAQSRQSNFEGSTEMVTLDDYFSADKKLPDLHWLKIDTEGYEWEVIQGASRLINTYKPNLFIEINNEHLSRFGSSQQQLFGWVQAQGYKAFIAETMQEINLGNPLVPSHFDMIARHNSKKSQ